MAGTVESTGEAAEEFADRCLWANRGDEIEADYDVRINRAAPPLVHMSLSMLLPFVLSLSLSFFLSLAVLSLCVSCTLPSHARCG